MKWLVLVLSVVLMGCASSQAVTVQPGRYNSGRDVEFEQTAGMHWPGASADLNNKLHACYVDAGQTLMPADFRRYLDQTARGEIPLVQSEYQTRLNNYITSFGSVDGMRRAYDGAMRQACPDAATEADNAGIELTAFRM